MKKNDHSTDQFLEIEQQVSISINSKGEESRPNALQYESAPQAATAKHSQKKSLRKGLIQNLYGLKNDQLQSRQAPFVVGTSNASGKALAQKKIRNINFHSLEKNNVNTSNQLFNDLKPIIAKYIHDDGDNGSVEGQPRVVEMTDDDIIILDNDQGPNEKMYFDNRAQILHHTDDKKISIASIDLIGGSHSKISASDALIKIDHHQSQHVSSFKGSMFSTKMNNNQRQLLGQNKRQTQKNFQKLNMNVSVNSNDKYFGTKRNVQGQVIKRAENATNSKNNSKLSKGSGSFVTQTSQRVSGAKPNQLPSNKQLLHKNLAQKQVIKTTLSSVINKVAPHSTKNSTSFNNKLKKAQVYNFNQSTSLHNKLTKVVHNKKQTGKTDQGTSLIQGHALNSAQPGGVIKSPLNAMVQKAEIKMQKSASNSDFLTEGITGTRPVGTFANSGVEPTRQNQSIDLNQSNLSIDKKLISFKNGLNTIQIGNEKDTNDYGQANSLRVSHGNSSSQEPRIRFGSFQTGLLSGKAVRQKKFNFQKHSIVSNNSVQSKYNVQLPNNRPHNNPFNDVQSFSSNGMGQIIGLQLTNRAKARGDQIKKNFGNSPADDFENDKESRYSIDGDKISLGSKYGNKETNKVKLNGKIPFKNDPRYRSLDQQYILQSKNNQTRKASIKLNVPAQVGNTINLSNNANQVIAANGLHTTKISKKIANLNIQKINLNNSVTSASINLMKGWRTQRNQSYYQSATQSIQVSDAIINKKSSVVSRKINKEVAIENNFVDYQGDKMNSPKSLINKLPQKGLEQFNQKKMLMPNSKKVSNVSLQQNNEEKGMAKVCISSSNKQSIINDSSPLDKNESPVDNKLTLSNTQSLSNLHLLGVKDTQVKPIDQNAINLQQILEDKEEHSMVHSRQISRTLDLKQEFRSQEQIQSQKHDQIQGSISQLNKLKQIQEKKEESSINSRDAKLAKSGVSTKVIKLNVEMNDDGKNENGFLSLPIENKTKILPSQDILVNIQETSPKQKLKQSDNVSSPNRMKAGQGQSSLSSQQHRNLGSVQTRIEEQTPQPSEPEYPLSAEDAVVQFSSILNDYERQEIQHFTKQIYYLGQNCKKKIKGYTINLDTPSKKAQSEQYIQRHKERLKQMNIFNHGYDDDQGDYQVILKDHLGYRYEILEFLGQGSFGQAIKCLDHKTQEMVAIKIIRNKKKFQYQAGIELRILKYLNYHDKYDMNNIIRVKDYTVFRKHLLISFECLSINLYEFIKNNNFQGVSQSLIRRFAIQILQALKYQKDHRIIHCDLKPENILLKQQNKSGIKVIDYGSSCFIGQRIYTYIQSRFYRAPEIILGIPYTMAIDMWSFGCIVAELFTGYPLFPGENEIDQLAYIMEICGIPKPEVLKLSSRKHLFFDKNNEPIVVKNSRGKERRPNTKTLERILKCQDETFLSFLNGCFKWNPMERMTPLQALQHPWILEGLPEKVLQHHKKMFCQQDDSRLIKKATQTDIQGFPPNSQTQNIYQIIDTIRKEEDEREKRREEQKIQLQLAKEEAERENIIDYKVIQQESNMDNGGDTQQWNKSESQSVAIPAIKLGMNKFEPSKYESGELSPSKSSVNNNFYGSGSTVKKYSKKICNQITSNQIKKGSNDEEIKNQISIKIEYSPNDGVYPNELKGAIKTQKGISSSKYHQTNQKLSDPLQSKLSPSTPGQIEQSQGKHLAISSNIKKLSNDENNPDQDDTLDEEDIIKDVGQERITERMVMQSHIKSQLDFEQKSRVQINHEDMNQVEAESVEEDFHCIKGLSSTSRQEDNDDNEEDEEDDFETMDISENVMKNIAHGHNTSIQNISKYKQGTLNSHRDKFGVPNQNSLFDVGKIHKQFNLPSGSHIIGTAANSPQTQNYTGQAQLGVFKQNSAGAAIQSRFNSKGSSNILPNKNSILTKFNKYS